MGQEYTFQVMLSVMVYVWMSLNSLMHSKVEILKSDWIMGDRYEEEDHWNHDLARSISLSGSSLLVLYFLNEICSLPLPRPFPSGKTENFPSKLFDPHFQYNLF